MTNGLWTLWQRWAGSKGDVPGGWKRVHTNTKDVVDKAAPGLRRYGQDQGIEGHEVKVTGPDELP